jgi:hypothetical protein
MSGWRTWAMLAEMYGGARNQLAPAQVATGGRSRHPAVQPILTADAHFHAIIKSLVGSGDPAGASQGIATR